MEQFGMTFIKLNYLKLIKLYNIIYIYNFIMALIGYGDNYFLDILVQDKLNIEDYEISQNDITGDLEISNGGIVLMTISSTGDVTITGSISGVDKIEDDDATTSVTTKATNETLIFKTNNNERMRITNGGNVGIGTNNPTSRFQIQGSETTTNDFLRIMNSGASTSGLSRMSFGQSPTDGSGGNGDSYGNMTFFYDGAGDINNSLSFGTGSTTDILQVRKDLTSDLTGRVNVNGLLGINQSNPTIDLAIGDSDTGLNSQGTDELAIYTGGIERIRFDSAGNVGIGTNSPSKLLDITGNYSSIVIHSTAQNQDSTLFFSTPFNTSSVAKTAIIAEGANTWNRSDLHFCLNKHADHTTEVSLNDAKMTILYSNGYVGIGENVPLAPLHIKDSDAINIIESFGIGTDAFTRYISYSGLITQSWSCGVDNVSANTFRISYLTGTGATPQNGLNVLSIEKDGDISVNKNILAPNGFVGINETSPDSYLHINWTKDSDGLKEMIKLSWDDAGTQDTKSNDGTKISFYTSSVNNNPGSTESAYIGAARTSGSEASHDTKLVFATKENSGSSLTEKMVINNNGQISLGEGGIDGTDSVIIRGVSDKIGLEIYTPTNSTTFDVLQITSNVGGTKNVNATIDADGDMSNSNGTYGNFSDVRLKENIIDCNSQWDDIKNFRFVNYNLINTPEQPQLGVIAQEIELVSSGLVKTTNNTKEVNGEIIENIKTVKTSIMYMKGLKALQEAILRIETLEKEVNLLKNN